MTHGPDTVERQQKDMCDVKWQKCVNVCDEALLRAVMMCAVWQIPSFTLHSHKNIIIQVGSPAGSEAGSLPRSAHSSKYRNKSVILSLTEMSFSEPSSPVCLGSSCQCF